ncbi:MAG: hypothetical protein WCA37_08845, partial [Terracidiphilus sp.]
AEALRPWGWLHAALALAAGGLLRAWMMARFFQANGDSLLYGDIAKNLLLHGRYGFSGAGGTVDPTLIRLPGYPLFLAACFRVFGLDNYGAVAWVQIVLELLGCLLLADVARRIAPAGLGGWSARATLWLAALCPFTAVYAATPLAEGPTLFLIAVALWAAVRFAAQPAWSMALVFTTTVTSVALMRPDGVLVALALAPVVAFAGPLTARRRAAMAVACLLLAALPFGVWTARNWRVFHVVQPLAPRSATDPGDPVYPGWEQWVRTWCLDFVSTYEVYWNVPGSPLDVGQLPERAFDTPAQRAETEALAAAYNGNGYRLTPAIDAGFARLAAERAAAHPWRTHVLLPLGRMADMWLRPRVENLPIDLDWWVYAHHNAETRFSWAYAALNAAYLALGVVGLWLRPRLWLPMLAYFVLRSALLLTVQAPEARYTLECFPMLFVLGGVALAAGWRGLRNSRPALSA